MPYCFYCGKEEEEFYYIAHIGTFGESLVYACRECKIKDLWKEIEKLSLCSTCKAKSNACEGLLEERFLKEETSGILFVIECEFYEPKWKEGE